MKRLAVLFTLLIVLSTQALADIESGLTGCWSFDEGDGLVVTDSAGSTDGTIVGEPSWNSDGYLSFDGEQYVTLNGISGQLPSDEMTISAWVCLDNLSGAKVIYNCNNWWEDGLFHFQTYNDHIEFAVWGYDALSVQGFTEANSWYHVAAVYSNSNSNSTIKLYINGEEAAVMAADQTLQVDLSKAACIAAWDNGTEIERMFSGDMDELRVYNRMLSDVDIAELYDSDGDGVRNIDDPFPYDPEDDVDGDSIGGDVDNCPLTFNPRQDDTDGDGIGNACDEYPNDPDNDIDGDGISGDIDNCPYTHNPRQDDADGDGIGDTCDDDSDNDGVIDNNDNCPATANSDQLDTDGDGIGDVCDVYPNDPDNDIDGDGISGDIDNCPYTYNPGQEDADGDGIGDACEGIEYIVDHNADNPDRDFDSIQTAIDFAQDGQVVTVMPGTYYENININGKKIKLQSSDPKDPETIVTTIINGSRAGSVITCNSGESSNTVISGFVITNGEAIRGGGLRISSSSPTISNCVISKNYAIGESKGYVTSPLTSLWGGNSYGGGIYISYSYSKLVNCTISYNVAKGGDGGYKDDSNGGGGGNGYAGGIYNLGYSAELSNCIIRYNEATGGNGGDGTGSTALRGGDGGNGHGGGLYNTSYALQLNECEIEENTTFGGEGGVRSSPGVSIIYDGDDGNSRGGGIYNISSVSWTIDHCTISNNTANSGVGGGIYNVNNPLVITACEFYANSPQAIYNTYTDGGNNILTSYDIPPIPVIVTDYFGDSDGDGDVDMEDFAAFAANWLK